MARYEITLAEFDALPWDVKNTWIPKAGGRNGPLAEN